ncbi:MAG: hypothetical protein AAF806_19955 [Bacteroidota bacterium]
MKYTKQEIFQIFMDHYLFQVKFDPEVDQSPDFNQQITIAEWREISDLVSTKKLAHHYHDFFELSISLIELQELLKSEKKTTLSDLCEYLAFHAERKEITPILLLGQSCQTAAIFKVLKENLAKRDIVVDDLKPSSKINTFFLKYGVDFLVEVFKIAPGVIYEYEYRDNKFVRTGSLMWLLSIPVWMLTYYFDLFHQLMLIPFITGILLNFIGAKQDPEKLSIGGYEDFRQLVYAMNDRL